MNFFFLSNRIFNSAQLCVCHEKVAWLKMKLVQFTWHIIANIAENNVKQHDYSALGINGIQRQFDCCCWFSPSVFFFHTINCLFVSVQLIRFKTMKKKNEINQTNRWCERFLSANCHQDRANSLYDHAACQLIATTMYYHDSNSNINVARPFHFDFSLRLKCTFD